jgi:hypothetical protein
VWSLSYGGNSFVAPRSASRRIIIHVHPGTVGRSNRYFQALPEVQMADRARCRFSASFLVLSLIIGPAAFAAAENSGAEKPSQAEPDSRSYLPPWMQGQGGSEKASAPENTAAPANATTPESKSAAADNESIKRRVRAGGQVRRSHAHTAPADGVIGGFVGFFGGR